MKNNIKILIKIKYISILLLGITYFVGTYLHDKDESDYLIIGSIFAGIFMATLHSLLWSDKAYKLFVSDGINIPYIIYQLLAIVMILFNLNLEFYSNIFHHYRF